MSFISFAVRRILLLIPTLLFVATAVFLGLRIVPSDPVYVILGNQASAEAVAQLRINLGLNRPLLEQYFIYMNNLVHGDLGRSLLTNEPVLSQILSVLPNSLELVLGGMIFGTLFGVPLGIFSAVRRNSAIDYVARSISLAGISIPIFFFGMLLLLLFSLELGWFPIISTTLDTNGTEIWKRLYYLFVPALTVGLILAAFLVRLTRSIMLETLEEDYVTVARAKGLRETLVIYNHALRNALIPIVTVLGVYLGVLIGDTVITETVFSRPGLGRLLVGGIFQRDYPVIQAGILFIAGFVAIANLLVDLSYGLIDPRVKYD